MDATAIHAQHAASSPTKMDDTRLDVDFPDPARTPLLLPSSQLRSKSAATSATANIIDDLRRFRASLKWCALDHSSRASRAASYLAFLLLALAVPLVSAIFIRGSPSSGLAMYRLAQLPESALAAIAFFTLSAFFRGGASTAGIRHLLLLDGLHDDPPSVRQAYARELDRSSRYLACILLPSFAVELAHKIVFFSNASVRVDLPLLLSPPSDLSVNSAMFLAVLAAWVYRTLVFLFVCVLVRLTCELQILRLEELRKRLEGGISGSDDAWAIFMEHTRIRKQLLVTSHRYRLFIIGCLITTSVSQLGALMLVLAPKSHNNFFNSGDLVVCSVVQLSGFFMSLMGAARITHRAHGIVAIATRWHMLVTSASSNALALRNLMAAQLVPARNPTPVIADGNAHSQLPEAQLASSFQTREALVNYLQHNKGGITLFGFMLDRGLLQALFVFEMTLVLWILSKVIVI